MDWSPRTRLGRQTVATVMFEWTNGEVSDANNNVTSKSSLCQCTAWSMRYDDMSRMTTPSDGAVADESTWSATWCDTMRTLSPHDTFILILILDQQTRMCSSGRLHRQSDDETRAAHTRTRVLRSQRACNATCRSTHRGENGEKSAKS